MRSFSAPQFWTHEFGRSRDSLAFLLAQQKSLGRTRVAIPTYACSVVYEVAESLELSVMPYPCDSNLRPIESALEQLEFDIFLYINYFGFDCAPTVRFLEALSLRAVFVIADNAHSFFKFENDVIKNKQIDASFTSLNKSLPVPGGSLLFQKEGDCRNVIAKTSFIAQAMTNLYLVIGFVIKFFSFRLSRKKACLESDSTHNGFKLKQRVGRLNAIDPISKFLFRKLNLSKIKSDNFAYYDSVSQRFSSLDSQFYVPEVGKEDFPSGVPLFFYREEARDDFVKGHIDRRIDVYVWPEYSDALENPESLHHWRRLAIYPLNGAL